MDSIASAEHDDTYHGHRLADHPQITFTVIVNPKSGPGDDPYPNNDYTAALKQLALYPNAKKVGYVRTGYASRNLSDVISELNTYSGWASKDAAFAMDGIFFDESPHQYSADAVSFMLSATQAVKSAQGFQDDKTVSARGSTWCAVGCLCRPGLTGDR